MKIRLSKTPPVDPELGLRKGDQHETVGSKESGRHDGVWILSKGGEPVKLLHDEYAILDPKHKKDIPGGCYVVRGPDRIVAGLELGKGKRFTEVKFKFLKNLAVSEQDDLLEGWASNPKTISWRIKTRVSMSPDIANDLTEGESQDIEFLQRRVEAATGANFPVAVINASRTFVEIIIDIIK